MEAVPFAVIFLVTFGVVAAVAGFAWALLDRAAESGADEKGLLRDDRLSGLSLLTLLLHRLHWSEDLKRLLAEAGLDWAVGRLILTSALSGAMPLAVLWRADWMPGFLAVGVSLAGAAAPLFYVRAVRQRRLRLIGQQLPDAVEYVGRAISAGHSLPMAMELAADDTGQPLSAELRKTVDEYNLGLPLGGALENLTLRAPSVDIQFFAFAIATQSRTGGNLPELLDTLAQTIRERETLKGQVRALTANGRMTAIVLSALPFAIAGVMYFVSRDYLMTLVLHPLGKTLLVIGVCSQAAAFLIIRRLTDIKV